jgi:hypothetical protein
MNGPSTHLTWSELACKDGTAYPDAFLTDGRLSELAALFEEVRALLGGEPLTVLSAYRTPAHNRTIGGAPNSQHVQGRAIDFTHAHLSPSAVQTRLKQAKAEGLLPSLGGLGSYRTFTHIDTRTPPAGRSLIAWAGGAQRKDNRG